MNEIAAYLGMIGYGVCLFLFMIQDIRTQQVSGKGILLTIPFLLLDLIFHSQLFFLERIAGAGVGGLFIAISKLTRGKIGTGDGIIIALTGWIAGITLNLEMLLYSFLFLMIAAILLLVIFHFNKKRTIPFLPFYYSGFLLCMVFHYG